MTAAYIFVALSTLVIAFFLLAPFYYRSRKSPLEAGKTALFESSCTVRISLGWLIAGSNYSRSRIAIYDEFIVFAGLGFAGRETKVVYYDAVESIGTSWRGTSVRLRGRHGNQTIFFSCRRNEQPREILQRLVAACARSEPAA